MLLRIEAGDLVPLRFLTLPPVPRAEEVDAVIPAIAFVVIRLERDRVDRLRVMPRLLLASLTALEAGRVSASTERCIGAGAAAGDDSRVESCVRLFLPFVRFALSPTSSSACRPS